MNHNLRNARKKKGYTQEAIAAEIGMSAQGFSKIERGEVRLTVDRAVLIAQLLEVDVQAILPEKNLHEMCKIAIEQQAAASA